MKPLPGGVGGVTALFGIGDTAFVQLAPEADVSKPTEQTQSTSKSIGTVNQ
jgi:hypothetical protein